jgi:hypothetical protein
VVDPAWRRRVREVLETALANLLKSLQWLRQVASRRVATRQSSPWRERAAALEDDLAVRPCSGTGFGDWGVVPCFVCPAPGAFAGSAVLEMWLLIVAEAARSMR